MKKIFPILLVGVLILSGFGAFASSSNNSTEKEILSLNFSKPQLQENNQYIEIDIKEANSYLIRANKPVLPTYTHTFTFPFGSKIKNVECKPSEIQNQLLSKKIIPSPEPVLAKQKITNTEKTVTYEDESYPNNWFEYDVGCGINKNERCIFVKLQTFPIQYYPSENMIKIASDFEINVEFEKPNQQTLTFNDEYDFIILTPSEFSSILYSLVAHKNNRDVSTKLVTLNEIYSGTYFPAEGRDDAEQIKYFIKNAIENWGITSVLLVGGDDKFPTRSTHIRVSSSDREIFVSDLYFADIYNETSEFINWDSNNNEVYAEYKWDGNTDEIDFYPDVYIGRLACVDSNEVTASVNKIINYENNKAYTQDWFTNLIAVGGDSFTDEYGDDSGINEGELVNDVVIDTMDGFIPYRIWASNGKLSGLSPNGVKEISNAIEMGAGFVDFSGHGNTNVYATHPNNASNWLPTPNGGYLNIHIALLQNGDKLPIVVTGACSVGKYNRDNDCFSWSFVSNPNGGGIASCGATALGYAYIGKWAPYGLVEGIATNMFEAYKDGAITFGEMWVRAINDYISSGMDAGDYKTLEEWQPFGDPTLAIAKESTRPVKPDAPNGPESGSINEEHIFTASTTDPDGDKIYYLFDWGDGEFSGWLGPYNSGETAETSYMWTEKGNYEIRVKAKDDHGVQSEWSDPLPVNMPKDKQTFNGPLFNIFERFPRLFPILRSLFGL
jgi:hypothetical protein